jgi:alpha-galactosidase
VVAHDGSSALFSFVALAQSQFSRPANIRLTGLDAASEYFVRVVEPAGAPEYTQIAGPKWFEGVKVSGAVLDKVGLRAPALRPDQALLIEVTRL